MQVSNAKEWTKRERTAGSGSVDEGCTGFALADYRLHRHEYLVESERIQVLDRVAVLTRFNVFHRRGAIYDQSINNSVL